VNCVAVRAKLMFETFGLRAWVLFVASVHRHG
jgi:hypothetical protein